MNLIQRRISTVLVSAMAVIPLQPKSGSQVSGQITFKDKGSNNLVIEYDLTGLKPKSSHGIHIHEFGDCSSDDAKSAGSHFDPLLKKHGSPHSNQKHAGDLGNIKSDKNGEAKGTKSFRGLSLTGTNAIYNLSVVVHAAPDDFKTQPSGNSGDRIACGVILSDDPAFAPASGDATTAKPLTIPTTTTTM